MISQNSSKNSAVKTVQHRMSRLRDSKLPFTSTFFKFYDGEGKGFISQFFEDWLNFKRKLETSNIKNHPSYSSFISFKGKSFFFAPPKKMTILCFSGGFPCHLKEGFSICLGCFLFIGRFRLRNFQPLGLMWSGCPTWNHVIKGLWWVIYNPGCCVYGIVEGVGSPSNFPWTIW